MNQDAPTVVRAARVLASAQGPTLGPTEIAIDAAGRIAAIRPVSADALTREEGGALVLPALANAHDHGRGLRTLAFGAQDQSLETWLPDLRRQPRVDPWLNAAVALGRMARSGVAAVNHCHNTKDSGALLAEAEAVSRAARDVGVRVAFGWPFFDRNPMVYGDLARLAVLMPPECREAIEAADQGMRDCATNLALFEQAKAFEHETFTLQYHPVAPQWTRPETLAAIARAARQDGRRVHMHLLETELQRRWADAAYPQGLIAWLDELGLVNDRLTVAHAVWLHPAEFEMLAQRGVTVSVNASSNLRLRSGRADASALIAAGVRVGLGLDGMALDDDEDMLRELRLAWHLNARAGPIGRGLEPRLMLKAALEDGRCGVLGPDGGGRIAIGTPADLLVLGYAAMASDCIVPDRDAVDMLMGRAKAQHVRELWVGGRLVVAERECSGIDLAALEARLTDEATAAYRVSADDEATIAVTKAGITEFYGKN